MAVPAPSVQNASMNPHDINDRVNLLSHRIYAEKIRENPAFRDEALAMIRRGVAKNGGTVGHRMWLAALQESWESAEARMLADTPEGKLLRSNSPFSQLIGISDVEQRIALWRQAKRELLVENDGKA